MWEEQRREQERKAQEIALMYRRGPPPTVGTQPLPPLVEHQEESVLEQINELLESTPIPPPHSSSPSPPPSPPTPTVSPPHLFSAKQNVEATELQDDRETIERELQELALMELAKPPEQSEEELSLASSGKQSGQLQATAEEVSAALKQDTSTRTDELNLKEESARPSKPSQDAQPSQPSQVGNDAQPSQPSQVGHDAQPSVYNINDADEELEAQLQELLKLSEMPNKDIVSMTLLESPPPPLPQMEAPKRQKTDSPPTTRPKPVRKAPSPPKQKPSKKASSKKNEESILSQKTRLPNQTEVAAPKVSKVQPDDSPPVVAKKEPPKSQPVEVEEAAKSVDIKQQPQVKSPTDRKLVFTPPPPPTSPPSSPPPSEESKSSTEQMKPIAMDSIPAASAVRVTPVSSDGTPSKPASVSTPKTPTTPVQSMSTQSDSSYHKEEMRTLTSDDVEVIGGMKISRVQRTKWTPKGSLTEFVTPPRTPTKGPFQEQIQQHYSYPMQDGDGPEPTVMRHGSSETQKTSKKPESYQRYSMPERALQGIEEDKTNRSMYPVSQQIAPERPQQYRTQWKSQEELCIKQQQQNHVGQQPPLRKTPPQQHHQQKYQQQQQQPQYTPNRPTTHQADTYRQSSVPNGHMATASYKSTTLPRNRQEDWRVNRSNTWSAVDRSSRDGPQPAYAVKAGNPYELCSRCHQMLGGGPVMAIPGAKTQYHLQCFVCRMCRNPLVGTVPKNTLVIIKSRHPHCHRCVSNNKGILYILFNLVQ